MSNKNVLAAQVKAANDNQDPSSLSEKQVKSIEADFEKSVQVADKDIDKWTRVRVQLREVGLLMVSEDQYSEFLNNIKKLLNKTNLKNVNDLLMKLVGRPDWANSYSRILERILVEYPNHSPQKTAANLLEAVSILNDEVTKDVDEAIMKIDLALEYGENAIIKINLALDEYDSEYSRAFKEKFSRKEFTDWLYDAAKLGDWQLMYELEVYIVNQFNINGDKPELAKRNIRDTLNLLAKFKLADRLGYLSNLNESEQGYIDDSSNKPLDKRDIN